MKKPYEKPLVYYESFELTSNIASACAVVIHNIAQGSCGLITPAGILFIDGICEFTPPPGNNQYCYHNPTDVNCLFNS